MCYAHLTRKQRYQIEELKQANCAVSCIAKKLNVHRSTIYRELKRGRQANCSYRTQHACERALRRSQRSAANHPTKCASVWARVRRYVRRDYSPEQARGWLWRWHRQSVSVPAIYAHIRNDRRAGGRLCEHLRYARRRRAWGLTAHLARNKPSIHDRPKCVLERKQIGHWEGDTFTGTANRHHTLTLVERSSRFLIMRHPRLAWSLFIARAAVNALRGKRALSITFDNGTQFADYKVIAKELDCAIFFADPGRPNQRGTCENTIGLVRQYILKGSSGHNLTRDELQRIADKLNHRPRKCLGFRTPHEVFYGHTPVALRS
jgi:IS30 family transposase